MVRRFLIFLLVFFLLHQFGWAQQKTGQSLEEVFAKTLEHHPLLMIGEKGLKLASEKIRINRQLKLPEISVLGGMNYKSDTKIFDKRLNYYSNLSNIHFGNSLSAEISQVIYNGGKIRYNILESELQLEKSIEESKKIQQEVKLLVAKHYIDLYKYEINDSIYSRNIDLAINRLKLTNSMYEQGTVTHDDVLKAELQLSELNLARERNLADREIIKNELFVASGIPNINTLHSELENTHIDLGSLSDYILDAYQVSPTLKMQEADLKLEQNRLKIEKSAWKPLIYSSANILMSSPIREVNPQLNMYAGFWNIGLSIKYNISGLYMTRAKVRKQKHQIDITNHQFHYSALKVENEIKSSYLRYSIAQSQIATRTKNVESAKESYRIAQKKYDAQLALFLELFNASNMLLETELKKASTYADCIYLYYELLFATGNI